MADTTVTSGVAEAADREIGIIFNYVDSLMGTQSDIETAAEDAQKQVAGLGQAAERFANLPGLPEQAISEVQGIVSRLSSLTAIADELGVMAANLKAEVHTIIDNARHAEEMTPLYVCCVCSARAAGRDAPECDGCGDRAHTTCMSSQHGDLVCPLCVDEA